MPTYSVTDPNTGRKLRLTGDSPPTQEELEQLFSQFQVETVDPQAEAMQALAAEQSPIDAALIAAGRGMATIGRGLGIVDPESDVEKQAFQALEKESPVATTIGEIAGETAPFLAAAPFAPAGLAARVGTSAALGAAEGGLIAKGKGGTDDQTLQSAGIGGAVAGGLELAFPHIGRFVGKIYRNVTGNAPTAPLLDESGAPTRVLQEALDKAGISFDDVASETQRLLGSGDISDPAALARKSFLESQGLTPTRAQITGDATDFQSQQEIIKKSGAVRRAIGDQDIALANKFDNAITSTGGSANRSNSPVVDYIADRSIDLDSQISQAYKAARDVAPGEKNIKLTSMVENLRGIAGSDAATGGLASAVKDTLKVSGVLPSKGFKIQGKIDVESAEEVRKSINSVYSSLTPFGKSKAKELKDALDLDVEKTVGSDIFKDARASKAKFESDLNRSKVNKFDKRNKSLVRDILENKINPDKFFNDAVLTKSTRSQDLEQLKRYLSLDGDEAGTQAWNDIRAEAMDFIKSASIKEVAGEPALSRAGLEKGMDRLGRDKLRVLFSPDERKFLDNMVKTSKLREPVRGTALGKGPSGQAIGELTKAVNKLPVVNLVFGDLVDYLSNKAAGIKTLSQPSLKAGVKPSEIGRIAAPLAAATTAQEQNK